MVVLGGVAVSYERGTPVHPSLGSRIWVVGLDDLVLCLLCGLDDLVLCLDLDLPAELFNPRSALQEYLAHKKHPPHPRTTIGP